MAATASFLATSITRLELFREKARIGMATGFFLKRESQWYLISNWHVFSGRSPASGQSRLSNGATPTHCGFLTIDLKDEVIFHKPYLFRLGDPCDGSATWFEHPTLRQDVDVGALPLADVVPGKAKDLLDPTGHDETMWIDLGGELISSWLSAWSCGSCGHGNLEAREFGNFNRIWRRHEPLRSRRHCITRRDVRLALLGHCQLAVLLAR